MGQFSEGHRSRSPQFSSREALTDREQESLRDSLLRNGATVTKPTFFSWLGVTMYLTDAAIDATLRSMATFPEGSEVVLTFLQPPMRSPHASLTGPSRLAQRVAELDEPFVSYFDQAKLKAKLLAAGFSSVEFLTPAIANSRYFQQRQSDLPLPKRTDIASALR